MPIASEPLRSSRAAPYTHRSGTVRPPRAEGQPYVAVPRLPPRREAPAPAHLALARPGTDALDAAVRAGLAAACRTHPALPALPLEQQRAIVQRSAQGLARGAVQDGRLALSADEAQMLAGLEVLELEHIAPLSGVFRTPQQALRPQAARRAALDVVAALLRAAPHLRRLNLADNALSPSELRDVLRAAPASLAQLSLGGNPVGANPMAAMPAWLWGSLSELSLVSTQLTDAGLRTLRLELAPNLRVLRLDDNAISGHGLANANLGDHRLQLLSLRRNRLHPPSSRLFAGLAELQADQVDLRDQHGAGLTSGSAQAWGEIYTLRTSASVGHWIRSEQELAQPIEPEATVLATDDDDDDGDDARMDGY